MIRVLIATVLLTVGLEAQKPAQPAAPSKDEAELLAVIDRFFVAFAANDFATMDGLRVEGSVDFVDRPADAGGTRLVRRAFTPGELKPGGYREQYWDPTVHVRGRIGIVWAPYEFWLDGKSHHCGIDVFEMVKNDSGWKIANLMWTHEPDGCAALRPSDPARVRPAL